MDDNSLDSSPESEQTPDFTFELPPEPKSGFVGKILLAVVLAVAIVAGGMAFGIIKIPLDLFGNFTKDTKKVQSLMVESSVPHLSLPEEISFVGAYRELYGDNKSRLFVASSPEFIVNLPKESLVAITLQDSKSLFFWMSVADRAALDGIFNRVQQDLQHGEKISTLQNKIWIARNEVPAFLGNTDSGAERLLVKASDKDLLLVKYPKDQELAVLKVLGEVFKIDAKDVSFVAPPPSGQELAQTIVSGNVTERKQAVSNLMTLVDPQPEAVAFLSKSLITASTEVKLDVVEALELLARKNPEAISTLVSALDDKSIRPQVMKALQFLGPTANAAVVPLKKIIVNKKEPLAVRKEATKTLSAIQPHSKPAKKSAAPTKKKKK